MSGLPHPQRWREGLGLCLGAGALAVVGLGLPVLGTGCPRTCVGVGCEDQFTAGLVGVFTDEELAAPLASGEAVSPRTAGLEISGTLALGPDWAVALGPGGLLVGSPVEGAVRSFAAGLDGTVDLTASGGFLQSERGADDFGHSLAVVPDLDGSGVDELLVGAPRHRRSGDTREDGAVYLFADLGEGFSGDFSADDHRLRVVAEDSGVRFGREVAGCADLDGDGGGDWLAAAPYDSREAELAGAVEVGLSSQLDSSTQILTGERGLTLFGSVTGAAAGAALSCRHPLLGGAVPDVAVGAPFVDGDHEAEGAVYLLEGAELADGSLEDQAALVLRGLSDEAWLGWSVATGDVDGDGLADLAAGAPGADGGRGEVLVWLGRLLAEAEAGSAPAARFRVTGVSAGDGLGRALAMGDLDGDGIDDLVIGAPRRNPDGTDEGFDSGAAYVFLGSPDAVRWRPLMGADEADLELSTAQQFLRTGSALATGDVDADGVSELALLQQTEGLQASTRSRLPLPPQRHAGDRRMRRPAD